MHPESKITCLNEQFSTTQFLTRKKPQLSNKAGDKFHSRLLLSQTNLERKTGGLRTKGFFKKSYPGKPLVTMITVVYNGQDYLEKTIQSVIEQSYNNVEYIIVDGGSDDNTLDIIQRYQDRIDYWISERDNGIYDAMNKGISLALGGIIGIINSDDRLLPNSLDKVVQASLNASTKEFVVHGKIALFKPDGTRLGEHAPKNIPWYYLFSTPFKHPATFISRDLYKKIGLFHLEFGLAADYDLMLRIISYSPTIVYLDRLLTEVHLVGITTGGTESATWRSLYSIIKRNTESNLLAIIGILGRMIHKVVEVVRSSRIK